MSLKRDKRGQVTIFVIIALVIIVFGVLIFIFLPKLNLSSKFDAKNPELFLQDCLEEDFQETINTISKQGGQFEPEGYALYQDEKIKYLCYTNSYLVLGIRQVPFVKRYVEDEINSALKPKVDSCFDSLVEKYKENGYEVNLKKGTTQAEVLPDETVLTMLGYNLVISKSGDSESFNSFVISLDNNLYQLLNVAEHILSWESSVGNSDTLSVMLVQNNLRIDKIMRSDGTKIYIIENKKTGEIFQFASRSLVFPIGFV